jgi:hypothetical protein
MLARFSERFRSGLLHFLTLWATPKPTTPRLSAEILATLRAITDAENRNDCRALGEARKKLVRLRNEGLAQEFAIRRAAQSQEAQQ